MTTSEKNSPPTDLKSALREWNKRKWEQKNQLMYQECADQNRWPWYCSELDKDIGDFLREYNMTSGKILDLGTCSGSQALALAAMGFDVVGTDVSETALEKAKEAARNLPQGCQIEFLLDDVVTTDLPPQQFDLIIDRGCFHSICAFSSKEYIANIKKILKDSGKLLLKTMSVKETRFVDYDVIGGKRIPMPFRFTEEELRKIFSAEFDIDRIEDSFFYSSVVDEPGRAYLTILSKKLASSD